MMVLGCRRQSELIERDDHRCTADGEVHVHRAAVAVQRTVLGKSLWLNLFRANKSKLARGSARLGR